MKTKDRIIEEALHLFSEHGYDGVSVKDIANAVGIKDSSLYKHFTSKKSIFTTILEEMSARMNQLMVDYDLPDAYRENAANFYSTQSVEDMIQLTKKVFMFYWKDEFASRFRRMLMIEQYKNPEAYEIYRKLFLEDSIQYISVVFQQLMECGYFITGDAELMAINYYTPFFYFIARYDNHPEQEEEVMGYIERYVSEFARIYTKS